VPEAAAAALADFAFEVGANTIGAYLTFYGADILTAAAVASSVYSLREDQRKARNRQLSDYNASLKDRYVMVRSTTEPRAIVLGRQRVSGPVAYIGSYGTNREHLVLCVILAAHQIDAVEAIYFDDEQVTLDGSGNVLAVNRRDLFTLSGTGAAFTLSSAPNAATVAAVVAYGSSNVALGVSVAGSVVTVSGGTAGLTGTVTITYQPAQSPYTSYPVTDATTTVALNGSGNGSVVLPTPPVAGSVHVLYESGGGDTLQQAALDAYFSLAGSTVTVTGAPVTSATATVSYQTTGANTSKARVRSYLGAPGQAADAAMITNLPGVWDSSHTLSGLAYLVVELDYDTDAFPSGLPNVSAQIRGALCYDPRSGATVWTQNPALHMRHVATHALLGRMSTAVVNDTAIAVAANICDTSTAYVVNGQTYTRPLYQSGLVVKTSTRAKDALDDLAKAMCGDWTFNGGTFRVRAGAYVTPLQTLDESWLAGGSPITVQTATARPDLVNNISGRFLDEQHDYVEVQYPRVVSSTYQAIDGADLPMDMPLNAVTFSGQAQQVVAARMRYVRAGLRFSVLCNMAAYAVEVFDTLYVTLPRFGWVAKVFEVLDISYTVDGGSLLTLKATDPSIWALGTSFSAPAMSANTLFPSPWQVPTIAGLTCASGTGQLLKMADGTVLTRVQVTWTAVTDALVLQGGGVDVRYGLAGTAEATWDTVTAERGQSTIYLTRNIREGLIYLIKARAANGLVNGVWSAPVAHQVVGKSAAPSAVAGLAVAGIPGGVQVTWTPNADVDYLETEVRYGASWAAGTQIFRGAAAGFVWPWPAAASYTVRVKHRDTSKNESAESTAAITVGTSSLIDTAQVNANAATKVTQDTYDFAGASSGGGSNIVQRTVNVTPAADCTIEFTATLNASVVLGDSGNSLGWYYTPSGGSATVLGGSATNSTARQDFICSSSFAATGGVAIAFELRTNVAGGNPNILLNKSSMRITEVKR
jgi:hypothetical protein